MESNNLDNFVSNFKNLLMEEEIINKNTIFKKLNSWDSLFILELIMMIDEKYNIKIETDVILNSNTIEDLHKKIF
jgi:acyl carrier protein